MFLKTIPLSSLRKQQNRKIVKIVSSCACVVIACMNTGNVELTLEIVIFVHCLHYFTLEVMTNKIYVCVNILYIFIYIHTHTYKHTYRSTGSVLTFDILHVQICIQQHIVFFTVNFLQKNVIKKKKTDKQKSGAGDQQSENSAFLTGSRRQC